MCSYVYILVTFLATPSTYNSCLTTYEGCCTERVGLQCRSVQVYMVVTALEMALGKCGAHDSYVYGDRPAGAKEINLKDDRLNYHDIYQQYMRQYETKEFTQQGQSDNS